jgi:hypothetical protein
MKITGLDIVDRRFATLSAAGGNVTQPASAPADSSAKLIAAGVICRPAGRDLHKRKKIARTPSYFGRSRNVGVEFACRPERPVRPSQLRVTNKTRQRGD